MNATPHKTLRDLMPADDVDRAVKAFRTGDIATAKALFKKHGVSWLPATMPLERTSPESQVPGEAQ